MAEKDTTTMGFRVSWLAIKGMTKSTALERAGLRDSGTVGFQFDSPLSCAELPDGWTLICADDFEFCSEERLRNLSVGGVALGSLVHEGVMYASASYFVDGREVWTVSHNAQEGIYDLDATGDLPAAFAAIRARLTAEQDREGGQAADVDYLFDIPIELAQEVTGYRHDLIEFAWGEPTFYELEAVS